jgi:hypothetical protein
MGDGQPNRAADDEERQRETKRERGGKVTCSLGWENEGGRNGWNVSQLGAATGRDCFYFSFDFPFRVGPWLRAAALHTPTPKAIIIMTPAKQCNQRHLCIHQPTQHTSRPGPSRAYHSLCVTSNSQIASRSTL